VVALIMEKMIAPGGQQYSDRRFAPQTADLDAITGTEQEIETQIDEPPVQADARDVDGGEIRKLIGSNTVRALLHVETAQPSANGVFVVPQGAIAIRGERAWDAAAARAVLDSAVARLWTISGIGAGSGPGTLSVATTGNTLIIANSDAVRQTMMGLASRTPQTPGAAYAARILHARELPKFERMMRLIDYPTLRAGPGDAREPFFFSENLGSLGHALSRIDSLTIESHDDGRIVRQLAVYKLL
jgi:hypothetical protein